MGKKKGAAVASDSLSQPDLGGDGEVGSAPGAESNSSGTFGQPESDNGMGPGCVPIQIHAAVASYLETAVCVATSAEQPLNLRAGPGLHYPVLEQLPDGTKAMQLSLPYDAVVSGWRMIRSETAVGWVDARYLVPAEV